MKFMGLLDTIGEKVVGSLGVMGTQFLVVAGTLMIACVAGIVVASCDDVKNHVLHVQHGVVQVKDPVCGTWVNRDEKARLVGTVVWDNAEWFFCTPKCRTTFLKDPTKYVRACDCKKINSECPCKHCEDTKEFCDCGSQ